MTQMRNDLGETRIAQSRPGSLRERFGIFGGLNCLHLSDAPETGAAEVGKWSKVVQLDRMEVELDKTSQKPDHPFLQRPQAAPGPRAPQRRAAARELVQRR